MMGKKQMSLRALARRRYSQAQIELENIFFGEAHRLGMMIHGQSYALTLDPLALISSPALGIQLRMGNEKMQLFFNGEEGIRQLDSRLSPLDWLAFPEEIQCILLESLFQTPLEQLGNLLGGGISIGGLTFNENLERHSLGEDRFGFQFQLHHPEENSPQTLPGGSFILSKTLAKLLARILHSLPLGRAHNGQQMMPQLRSVVGEILLSPAEVQDLQVGDVLLLPDATAFNGGQRTLVGIPPYQLQCKQQGNQLTLEKIITVPSGSQ